MGLSLPSTVVEGSGNQKNADFLKNLDTLASSVAGAGLTETSDVLAVGEGHGIDVTADAVDVDETELTVGGDLTGTVANAQIGAGAVGTSEAPTFVNSTVETLKIIRGIFDTNSTTPVEGLGFTLTNNAGAGDMTVTFTAAFSDVPSITLGLDESGTGANSVKFFPAGSYSASSFRVIALDGSFTQVDAKVHFTAIGPR